MATEARKNIRYERFLSIPMASNPKMSPRLLLPSFRMGGVGGNAKLNAPSSAEAPAAMRKVSTKWPPCSQLSQPMVRPAIIQPSVPSTRMLANSFCGFCICRKEMELTSASVGMYKIMYVRMYG